MRREADAEAPTIVVTRRFAAPPDKLFAAWFDARTAGGWLFATPGGASTRVTIDARVGGRFEIHEQRAEGLATHFGEYRDITPSRRIAFAFGPTPEGPFSPVSVDIRPDGAGSALSLTHALDPAWAAMALGVRAGWEGILEGLARATGEPGRGHTLIIRRSFEAPRILVWKAWTEAQHLLRWLCPDDFRVLFAENDLRIGGKWRSGMQSPDGAQFIHCGEYLEIDRPSRLVFTHRWERNHLEPQAETTVTVVLNERDGKTDMTFIHAGLATADSACSHRHGWTGAFRLLATSLPGA